MKATLSGRMVGLLILAAGAAEMSRGEEALTARDVAVKAHNRVSYRHDECTALVMRLFNGEGQVRTREFLRYQIKGNDSTKRTLLKFSYPNDIKDMGTYNEEVAGKDDVQYLYLPASDKLRRVSSKSTAWMGSDFNFEDIMEPKLDNFSYTDLKSETFDGHACHVYTKTPTKSEHSIYGRQVEWVRKEGFLPVKTVFYDKDGKELKVFEFTDLRDSGIAGVKHSWKIQARNVQDNHRTELVRLWLRLDTGLDDKCASADYLKKSIAFYNHPTDLWSIWEQSRKQEGSPKADGPMVSRASVAGPDSVSAMP